MLYNGRVITVDGAFSIAEAVGIAGDRIVAVGTTAEVRAIASPAARQIDLRGRALIPGLMDNHLHSAGGGPGVDLSRARSLDDVYAAIRARAQTTMPGDAIVSNSDWHEAQLKEQRLPLRDDLDRVAPNHPVILIRGGHEYIVNSAVLRRWGVDDKTTDPEGGRLTRYPDGRSERRTGRYRAIADHAAAAAVAHARRADGGAHRRVQDAERRRTHDRSASGHLGGRLSPCSRTCSSAAC